MTSIVLPRNLTDPETVCSVLRETPGKSARYNPHTQEFWISDPPTEDSNPPREVVSKEAEDAIRDSLKAYAREFLENPTTSGILLPVYPSDAENRLVWLFREELRKVRKE